MAKPSNPLGTSTGIGKGEAQVFGSTYNSIFKDKLAQAEKKDKELKGAMAEASDMSQLWSRDVSSFKPMVNEYQNFVRQNAKALIKGDFDATVKNQQMMNKLTQYASSSKESQKFYNDSLKAMLGSDKFYKKDVDKLRSFGDVNNSGNFDYSKYGVNPKIDVAAINKGLQESVSKMGLNVEKLELKTVGNERVLVDKSTNKDVDLKPLISMAYQSAVAQGGQEQADEFLNQEWENNLIENLPNFLKETRKTTMPYKVKPVSDTAGGQNAIALANRRKEMIYKISHNINADEELKNFEGKFNPSISGGKSQVVIAELLEPGAGSTVPNRTVHFQTEDGTDYYYDVTNSNWNNSFNSIISNFKGQANLDDNALAKVDDYVPKSGEEGTEALRGGSLERQGMYDFLKGYDKIEDLDLEELREIIKRTKSPTVKSRLRKYNTDLKSSDEDVKEEAFSKLLSNEFKGKSFDGKEIKEIESVSPGGGSDFITLKYKDGTTKKIKLDDKDESLANFLNSMYDETPSSKKKSVNSKKNKPLPKLKIN
tara:strand:+ start:2613 stop:4229 length:1617 start_codon:yes stop_codon:yes gene_type:complete